MDTDSTAVLAQRVSRRAAARNVVVIGVISCLTVVGFTAAVTGAGARSSAPRWTSFRSTTLIKAIAYRWCPSILRKPRRPS